MIIIRKYPNRRLYDTSSSQYVNLEHIRQLVLDHKRFKVVDSKSEEDLTRTVLLQIIADQEASEAQALLTNTVLEQLIRFYGSNVRGIFQPYLEQSLTVFIEQQERLQRLMKEFPTPQETLKVISELVTSQMSTWTQFLDGKGNGTSRED